MFKLIESLEYPGFFIIPFANESIININGDVFNLNSKEYSSKCLDKRNSKFSTTIRNNGKIIHISLHRLLGQVFIENIDKTKTKVICKNEDYTNLNLDNLEWVTPNFIQFRKQKEIYLKNRQLYPLPSLVNGGLYPYAVETDYKPGFYHIPFIKRIYVISKDGIIYNPINRRIVKPSQTKYGYLIITLTLPNAKTGSMSVHRIVAMLFVPKPERHLDKSFDELQVNHIDGITSNNHYTNLEWVTGLENTQHAIALAKNKAIINGIKNPDIRYLGNAVLARNIKTNKIDRYYSALDCSKKHNLLYENLCYHLRSDCAGRMISNGYVFKLDDGKEWPTKLIITNKTKFKVLVAQVAINVLDKRIIIFGSLGDACRNLNINYIALNNSRARKGIEEPFENWIFIKLKDYKKYMELKQIYAAQAQALGASALNPI